MPHDSSRVSSGSELLHNLNSPYKYVLTAYFTSTIIHQVHAAYHSTC